MEKMTFDEVFDRYKESKRMSRVMEANESVASGVAGGLAFVGKSLLVNAVAPFGYFAQMMGQAGLNVVSDKVGKKVCESVKRRCDGSKSATCKNLMQPCTSFYEMHHEYESDDEDEVKEHIRKSLMTDTLNEKPDAESEELLKNVSAEVDESGLYSSIEPNMDVRLKRAEHLNNVSIESKMVRRNLGNRIFGVRKKRVSRFKRGVNKRKNVRLNRKR